MPPSKKQKPKPGKKSVLASLLDSVELKGLIAAQIQAARETAVSADAAPLESAHITRRPTATRRPADEASSAGAHHEAAPSKRTRHTTASATVTSSHAHDNTEHQGTTIDPSSGELRTTTPTLTEPGAYHEAAPSVQDPEGQVVGLPGNFITTTVDSHVGDDDIHLMSECVPLDAGVDMKLKIKIWSDEYIDFTQLLRPHANSHMLQVSQFGTEGQQIILPPNNKKPYLKDFNEWIKAFFIFVSIYSKKHPGEIPALMKYADNIRELSADGGNWRFFDEQFRKLRQNSTLRWDTFHSELWLKSVKASQPFLARPDLGNKRQGGPNPRTGNKNNNPPTGFCWRYHRGEQCTGPCNFQHDCWKCHGRHRASTCTSQLPNPNPPAATYTPSAGNSNPSRRANFGRKSGWLR